MGDGGSIAQGYGGADGQFVCSAEVALGAPEGAAARYTLGRTVHTDALVHRI